MSEASESDGMAGLVRGWAAEAAASGDFERAEKILSALSTEAQAAPEVLDLRARMLAQRKRFREAAALWRQAKRLAPETPDYEAALLLCERLAGRPKLLAFPRERVTAGVALVALVAGVLALSRAQHESRSPSGSEDGRLVRTAPASVLAPMTGVPSGGGTSPSDEHIEPIPALHVVGVRSKPESHGLNVIFEEPLFGRSARLLPRARERLNELGRALRSADDGLVIEVVGHTDGIPVADGSRFPDNAALALARAVAVAEELRRESGVPSGDLSSRIGQPEERPWPDATDRRNRTTSLKISHRMTKG